MFFDFKRLPLNQKKHQPSSLISSRHCKRAPLIHKKKMVILYIQNGHFLLWWVDVSHRIAILIRKHEKTCTIPMFFDFKRLPLNQKKHLPSSLISSRHCKRIPLNQKKHSPSSLITNSHCKRLPLNQKKTLGVVAHKQPPLQETS